MVWDGTRLEGSIGGDSNSVMDINNSSVVVLIVLALV